jgi:mannose/fructose-specific phosphotransferase system component IIA
MSDELKGVVVCHGSLAKALVDAAEQISGIHGALTPVSNTGCDRDLIEQRIAAATNGAPAVVFVDMPSGSCLFGALQRRRLESNIEVVTGVNLAMLVDFVFHRGLPVAEAARRAALAGEKAIRAVE